MREEKKQNRDGQGRTPTDKDKEARLVKAAELYVQGPAARDGLYDHYAKLHADWIALRKAGKTDQRFKDYVVSEDVRDARQRHPYLPAAALEGIGEMARIWTEAWYG